MRMCAERPFVEKRRRFFSPRVALAFVAAAAIVFTRAPANAQQEDLSALFAQARDEFRPVSEEELAEARADVLDRMEALERFVGPSTRNGARWLRYLRWDALREALAADPPNLRPLAATYRQLNRDETGLELPPFRRLSDALWRYMQFLQITEQEDQAEYYRSQLDRLEQQLGDYRQEPSVATEIEIGNRLAFIDAVGGAPELVAAIRREFARPNAFMDVRTSLIAVAADPIDRREPVTDWILGTNIRSDTHTVGKVGVASIPSEERAVLEFVSHGRVWSDSVGHNGPAVICSTSQTDFTATKRVELSDEVFAGRSSRARATTDTHLQSVSKRGGGLGSRIVSNVGWRRARQNERQAEAIAADHAEDRIERRFNREVNDEIRQARERYEAEYRRPLERRGELPEYIRFSSDRDSVGVEATQAHRGQLGAIGPPPPAPDGYDMNLRLHTSAVNNYSASVLGGATASETEPGQDVRFDVELPGWIKEVWEGRETEAEPGAAEEPFEPWSLRFRDGRPLTVDFAEGTIRLTIHIARLQSGDRTFSNWDVTGTYAPELVDGGLVLRRDADLVMLPADFRGTLSPRQAAERRNLEEELNARTAQGGGFPRTIEFDALEPEGALAEAGPLAMRELVSEGGWLTVAWNRE